MSTELKPGSRCAHCRHELWKHGGAEHCCPDGRHVFAPRPLKPPHTGQSFTAEQVNWLGDVLQTLQLQADQQHAALRKLARDPVTGSLAAKVAAMKASSAGRKGRDGQ